MPNLSWDEIRRGAIQFSRDWKSVTDERAEAQTFWNEFFEVFGIKRRTVAVFEEKVRNLKQNYGRIDLFWSGKLLAEHKSATQDISKAESQAFQYIHDLASENRRDEIPRYIILSNFRDMAVFDLEPDGDESAIHKDGVHYARIDFSLADLHKHIKHFAFMIGQATHKFGEEDPANLKAAQIMADLHDSVQDGNYSGEDLERLLVRVLFCLFADDTGIFEAAQFELYVRNNTQEDGGDFGSRLNTLFETLNTSHGKRNKFLEEDLADFPYVNGELFAKHLPTAGFNRDMRTRLLAACDFDWSRISPAIFGSLFQGIMDSKERRRIGAHYTSERNIMKVIRPLFLDELQAEFGQIKKDTRKGHRTARLERFQAKLARLTFLDPACGCGNFLVIAYRELRRLELQLLEMLYSIDQPNFDMGEIGKLSQVDVNTFYGIEIGEWPSRIAETALWLTDHQMNIELSSKFGNLFQRIPLKASPHIRCANALRIDWNDLLPAEKCSYVLGNPPFIGAKLQDIEQKRDVKSIAGNIKGSGLLDYVTMWYFQAAEYSKERKIPCAFVSTNSISQGEQVGVFWGALFQRGVKIHFAHRTFSWQSEAKGKAHVHVVIIGFGLQDIERKRIFEYNDINGEPSEIEANNISPYLVEASDMTILNRSKPICGVPEIGIGNKPIDGGFYLFDDEEKVTFLANEPGAAKFFRPWIGSREFLHGYHRWCLWLGDAEANELRILPECLKRVEKVRELRKASRSELTQKLAESPRRFHVENFPKGNFLVMPEVSSERRMYIPLGYMSPPTICSNAVKLLPNATPYHFGVLTSEMHMAWVRQVCGRLKSDFRYSAKLVYNNFPWPVDATKKQKAKVEECAHGILNARVIHEENGSCLADLYDPLMMPSNLLKAHKELDKAVDKCYRTTKFVSERERVEILFGLHEQLTAPLAKSAKKKRRSRSRR
jgi:hypothetical protein